MIKKVLIASGIVIVVAGLVFGGLWFFRPAPAPTAQTPDGDTGNAPLTADTSKDFGACTLVKKADISSALGSVAGNLQDGQNMGLIKVGVDSGDQAQTCVYAFAAGGTIDNAFGADNGLSIEVYVHKDQASADASVTNNEGALGMQKVGNLGDAAFYETIELTTPAVTRHILTVYEKDRHYGFTLSQPTASSSISAPEAQEALEKIARTAGL
jgi:hypothetical protein